MYSSGLDFLINWILELFRQKARTTRGKGRQSEKTAEPRTTIQPADNLKGDTMNNIAEELKEREADYKEGMWMLVHGICMGLLSIAGMYGISMFLHYWKGGL